jgi:hypothetical protein
MLLAACSGGDASLGKVILTHQEDPAGLSGESETHFAPGDRVFLAVEFLGAYQGLKAKVTWFRGEEVVRSSELEIQREVDSLDPLWMTDELQTGADWAVGSYRCEVFVPDQGTTSLEFSLE